jgi:hypothetical protein
MDHDHKERAKELLGFLQVPFYIVFDDSGTMVFSGSKLPDLNDLLLPTTKEQTTNANTSTPLPSTKTTSEASSPIDVTALDFDELDF